MAARNLTQKGGKSPAGGLTGRVKTLPEWPSPKQVSERKVRAPWVRLTISQAGTFAREGGFALEIAAWQLREEKKKLFRNWAPGAAKLHYTWNFGSRIKKGFHPAKRGTVSYQGEQETRGWMKRGGC